jgi:hypothetical protein
MNIGGPASFGAAKNATSVNGTRKIKDPTAIRMANTFPF